MSSQGHHAHDSATPTPIKPIVTRRARMIAIGVALGASALALWGASHFQRPAPAAAQANPDLKVEGNSVSIARGAPQWQLVQLGVAQASAEEWTDFVPASVKVDEAHAARIGAPLNGRVNQVFVELGQPVKSGDPLFSVASPDMAALKQDLAAANASLAAARAQHERVQAMVQARALPAKEEITTSTALRQAELASETAQAKLSALKVSSNTTNEFVVKSPRAGFVVDKNVLPGQEIGPEDDSELMMIADLSSVWVVAELFEANAAELKPAPKGGPSTDPTARARENLVLALFNHSDFVTAR